MFFIFERFSSLSFSCSRARRNVSSAANSFFIRRFSLCLPLLISALHPTEINTQTLIFVFCFANILFLIRQLFRELLRFPRTTRFIDNSAISSGENGCFVRIIQSTLRTTAGGVRQYSRAVFHFIFIHTRLTRLFIIHNNNNDMTVRSHRAVCRSVDFQLRKTKNENRKLYRLYQKSIKDLYKLVYTYMQ